MNAPIPLIEAHITPYLQSESVVRLFQKGRWYAGYVSHLIIIDDKLGILIGPMMRFGYFQETIETQTLHNHLIKEVDRPIKDSRIELSNQFLLPNPMKQDTQSQQKGVLHVESSDGKVTISMRDEDISSVKSLFERESNPLFTDED